MVKQFEALLFFREEAKQLGMNAENAKEWALVKFRTWLADQRRRLLKPR
jgi:hypothetical protein